MPAVPGPGPGLRPWPGSPTGRRTRFFPHLSIQHGCLPHRFDFVLVVMGHEWSARRRHPPSLSSGSVSVDRRRVTRVVQTGVPADLITNHRPTWAT